MWILFTLNGKSEERDSPQRVPDCRGQRGEILIADDAIFHKLKGNNTISECIRDKIYTWAKP